MGDPDKPTTAFESHGRASTNRRSVETIHETWLTFMNYCANLQYGEIERLKIQDGLPMLAEVIKVKIKFTR